MTLPLVIEHADPVAVVRMQCGKTNALNSSLMDHLNAAFKTLAAEERTRAVVWTSALPKFFSPGFDLHEVIALDRDGMRRFVTGFLELFHRMHRFPKPVLAALNGHTVAGGFCLSLACDFRYMAEGPSVIGLNELKIGVVIPFGVLQLLESIAAAGKAREIALFGLNYSPQDALQRGLVDRVLPPDQLQSFTLEQARLLADKSAPATAVMKRYLRQRLTDFVIANDLREVETFLDVWFSADTQRRLRENLAALRKQP